MRSSRRRPTSTTRRSSPTSRRASGRRCAASRWKPSRSRSGWPSEAGKGEIVKIGVLALQGAFREHLQTLDAIGVEGVPVRLPADLEGVAGLILPGGESTTMRQLIERWGLAGPILDLAHRGAPLFGTCAGMIVLSRQIVGG